MNRVRRTILKTIGAWPMAANGAGRARAALRPEVKPRHVLCFLGGAHELARLSEAADAAIAEFAFEFSVDTNYSLDRPDPHMSRSFGVCWDRVAPHAWSQADEDAVTHHGSVLYVLGPPMTVDSAVTASTAALMLVDRLIRAGAVAVKGESAGVAHGLERWRTLFSQLVDAAKANDDVARSRVCRLAFARRPLESEHYVESVGYHLVGLPEVYVAKSLGTDFEKAMMMDVYADDMAKRGVEAVLRDRKARLSFDSRYKDDDFKFNPYGIVHLDP